jgi:hypothetical protein
MDVERERWFMTKRILLCCLIGFFALTLLYAEEPKTNINPAKHPNLAKAQTLINEAFDSIVAAQKANEFDLGGHAAKAKGLLEESSKELKLAAIEANKGMGTKAAEKAEEKAATEEKPATNISETKHPNLGKAQQLIDAAYARILEAQKANDFDLKGHAAKAKDLLEQASSELKLAAQAANK